MSQAQTIGALNEVFHVFNRGVEKRDIFLGQEDYLRFYESLHLFNNIEPITNFTFARLQERKKKEKLVEVEAYSILPNHFHLILRQTANNGIGEFMKRVCGGYTRYFNDKNERSGVLFQGAYKRVHVKNDEQYRYLLAYVNENHTVHNIPLAEEIMFSSTWHYRNLYRSKLIAKDRSYDWVEGSKIAKEIYVKRSEYKGEVFDE